MAADPFGDDDTASQQTWDACWDALEDLPGRDLPTTAAVHAEAIRIIDSYRAVTEGRGIEQIEERARVAYRLAADRLAGGADEHLNRVMAALDGALSVLRRGEHAATRHP